jgi:MinD-like ATPase involved in chromosome partitioning or flagellar assembly
VTANNDGPQVFSDGPGDDEARGPWFSRDTGGYPADPGYPAPGDQQEPEYPRGPGYAPLPHDHLGPGAPGYPAAWGHAARRDLAHEPGPSRDGWVVPAPRPAHDVGDLNTDFGPAAGSVPLAPLPDAGTAPPSAAGPPGPARRPSRLTAKSLRAGQRPGPGTGWRHRIFQVTGGLLRLGEPAAEMRRRDLINRVRTPLAGGHHRVAVLSLKGGVGKTTTTVGLGAALATLRGDRVVAVDANPDRGTLSDKVHLETSATIRDLLNERDQIRRYADVRAFTTQAPSRLEVLASDRDPAMSVAFSGEDYCDAARVLEPFYSICLTDCGTGLLHSAMSGVLRMADQIVVVSSPSVDGARSASATLDWLDAHGRGDLVSNGIVVLSAIRPRSKSTVDLDRLEQHFAARCRAVARIPYDPHLEEGAEVELELLTAQTADAYLALAALVGDGLTWPRRLTYRFALP